MKPKLTKEERAANRRIFFKGTEITTPTTGESLDAQALEMLKKLKEQRSK